MLILSQIFLYPIKSLAGIQVQSWLVDKNGLRYDRKWMLVDEDGQFMSQRRLPQMALIKTRIEQDHLIVSAAGMEDMRLALQPDGGDDIEVIIWHDRCAAKIVSKQADEWFSEFLNTKCSLVYHPDGSTRQVDQRYAKRDDQTAFADGFPFLITAESSLQALNEAMPFAIGMNRFRPNLVISGCDRYAEDSWRRIRVNDIEFRLPKPCSRCSVPGINPDTAISDKETLLMLSRLRKWENRVYFGQNALHDSLGKLAVGNAVDVLETGSRQPPVNVEF